MSRSCPLVSIILPTFNRAHTIRRAIISVMNQTIRDWELVVVDDGSTDETESVVRSIAADGAGRLVYVKQDNAGASTARNTGIDHARGEFVAFLDSDDEFAPTKLGRQLELFSLQPDLGCVYSDFSFVDQDSCWHQSYFRETKPNALLIETVSVGETASGGETVSIGETATVREAASVGESASVESKLYVCAESLFNDLLSDYFIATIVGMVRRDVLGNEIGFHPDVSYAEEWLFYLRLSRICRFGFVDEPLSIHHHTAGSLARTDATANTANLKQLLLVISDTFPDLDSKQRRSLRRRYANTCRQLGYDALRAGKPAAAASQFAEAFRNHVSARNLREWAINTARSRVHRIGAMLGLSGDSKGASPLVR